MTTRLMIILMVVVSSQTRGSTSSLDEESITAIAAAFQHAKFGERFAPLKKGEKCCFLGHPMTLIIENLEGVHSPKFKFARKKSGLESTFYLEQAEQRLSMWGAFKNGKKGLAPFVFLGFQIQQLFFYSKSGEILAIDQSTTNATCDKSSPTTNDNGPRTWMLSQHESQTLLMGDAVLKEICEIMSGDCRLKSETASAVQGPSLAQLLAERKLEVIRNLDQITVTEYELPASFFMREQEEPLSLKSLKQVLRANGIYFLANPGRMHGKLIEVLVPVTSDGAHPTPS